MLKAFGSFWPLAMVLFALIISLKLPLGSSTPHPAFRFLPAQDMTREKRPNVNTHSVRVCVHKKPSDGNAWEE